MEEKYFGFDIGKVMIGMLKMLRDKGVFEEQAILDLLWDAKDPYFPWNKQDIKELIKL